MKRGSQDGKASVSCADNRGFESRPRHQLTPDEQDNFNERAAIMQFDGGLPYEQANREAHDLIISRRGM